MESDILIPAIAVCLSFIVLPAEYLIKVAIFDRITLSKKYSPQDKYILLHKMPLTFRFFYHGFGQTDKLMQDEIPVESNDPLLLIGSIANTIGYIILIVFVVEAIQRNEPRSSLFGIMLLSGSILYTLSINNFIKKLRDVTSGDNKM